MGGVNIEMEREAVTGLESPTGPSQRRKLNLIHINNEFDDIPFDIKIWNAFYLSSNYWRIKYWIFHS